MSESPFWNLQVAALRRIEEKLADQAMRDMFDSIDQEKRERERREAENADRARRRTALIDEFQRQVLDEDLVVTQAVFDGVLARFDALAPIPEPARTYFSMPPVPPEPSAPRPRVLFRHREPDFGHYAALGMGCGLLPPRR